MNDVARVHISLTYASYLSDTNQAGVQPGQVREIRKHGWTNSIQRLQRKPPRNHGIGNLNFQHMSPLTSRVQKRHPAQGVGMPSGKPFALIRGGCRPEAARPQHVVALGGRYNTIELD
jgi:hypothetical protein